MAAPPATKATNASAAAQVAAKTAKHAVNPAAPTSANHAAALNTNAMQKTSNVVLATAAHPKTQPVADQSTTAIKALHVALVPRKTMMGPTIISVPLE